MPDTGGQIATCNSKMILKAKENNILESHPPDTGEQIATCNSKMILKAYENTTRISPSQKMQI
jgi:hypothetical protein